MARALEGDELVGKRHHATEGVERLAIGAVGVLRLVIVVVADAAEPDFPVRQTDGHADRVVGQLLEAAQEVVCSPFMGGGWREANANPRARHIDVAEARHIASLQALEIKLHGGYALGAYHALRERVARPHQLLGRLCLQAQATAAEAPLRVVGVVVPLPDAAQRLAVEVVGAEVGRIGLIRLIGLMGLIGWLEPRPRCTAEIAGEAHHGPSVLPGHGHQAHGAADAVEVLHEERPPRAVGGLHNAALMGIAARRSVRVGRGDAEAGAVAADAVLLSTRHLREGRCMIAVGFIGGDDARLVRTIDIVRARAERAPVGHIVGGDEVVAAVDLVHVVPLAYPIALGDDDALGALHGAAHVGLQLGALHRAVAVDGVDFAVVVEEHAKVVDIALHVVVGPRPADVPGGVALQALAVDVGEYVELPIGIADARSPDALTVDLAVVLKREGIVGEVKAVEAVAHVLPVDKVLAVEDDQPGHGVHRRACEVVVIAHADDVGIGELVVEQGVGEGAVAVVGGPGLCLCCTCHHQEGAEEGEHSIHY